MHQPRSPTLQCKCLSQFNYTGLLETAWHRYGLLHLVWSWSGSLNFSFTMRSAGRHTHWDQSISVWVTFAALKAQRLKVNIRRTRSLVVSSLGKKRQKGQTYFFGVLFRALFPFTRVMLIKLCIAEKKIVGKRLLKCRKTCFCLMVLAHCRQHGRAQKPTESRANQHFPQPDPSSSPLVSTRSSSHETGPRTLSSPGKIGYAD